MRPHSRIRSRRVPSRDALPSSACIATGEGHYRGSSEELTPVRLDWLSAVPLAMTTALLLASPQIASSLARGGFGAHLLDRSSIRMIEGEDFA